MSLNDREILELNELCNELIDETISETQRARLEEWLADSEDARQFYVKAMDLSASLVNHAAEMQIEAADSPMRSAGWRSPANWLWAALAASIALAATSWLLTGQNPPADQATVAAADQPVEIAYVARVTGAKDSVWLAEHQAFQPGDFLRRGQCLDLARGFAEVTFDSGAVVLLEGPAMLEINSAWDSTLRRGALTAHTPPQAIGFRISNSAVEVVDVGTQFSMIADDDEGTADVFVLEGEVEAVPLGRGEEDPLLLRANESRRFGSAGVSGTTDHDRIFARFRAPVTLDPLAEPVNYLHWTFDAADHGNLPAAVFGFEPNPNTYTLTLLRRSPAALVAAQAAGFRDRGLRFDGKQVAKARFPGLSGSFPRTIAFWVQVPENARLSSAYSIVAWRGDSEKLGSRPVHIGWNRNPNEGPLGAIRTDFSGGHAMGTTPLRDGRWHHVTVIFLTGEDPDEPVQVKLYLDGRLESNTVTPGPRRSIRGNLRPDEAFTDGDLLWLGCRLGSSGPKRERFVGCIDELVIADRSLEPNELVRLMDGHDLDYSGESESLHARFDSSAK